MIIYVWIFCLIFTGFLLLFGRIRWVETAKRLLSRTKKGMDQSARLRVLENRHKLQELQRNNTWICRVEEFLCYCGMRRRFPACTPEKWIVGNLLGMTVIFGVLLGSSGKFQVALLGIMICGAMEYLFLSTLRAEELRVTNENLLKCLNFLGNYSLTAGEITMVLGQVSRYVEEPLKGALEECAYEAQTTRRQFAGTFVHGGTNRTSQDKGTGQKSGDQYPLYGRSDHTGRQQQTFRKGVSAYGRGT